MANKTNTLTGISFQQHQDLRRNCVIEKTAEVLPSPAEVQKHCDNKSIAALSVYLPIKPGIARKPRLTPEQIQELKQKRRNGTTIEALMKEYSITKMAVYYHLDGIRVDKTVHKKNLSPKTRSVLEQFLYGKL